MKLKLELEQEKMDVILQALGQQPYVRVAPLIAELMQQLQPQLNPIKE